jgi:hypothetical protein
VTVTTGGLLAGFALVVTSACRSAGDDRWSFRMTESCLNELDEAADHPPKVRHSTPYCGGIEELPAVGIVILFPLLLDLAILPVTGVHDLFWS